MTVLSNLLVRAPKIPGPAGGKQENFVVMYTSYVAHQLKSGICGGGTAKFNVVKGLLGMHMADQFDGL